MVLVGEAALAGDGGFGGHLVKSQGLVAQIGPGILR